MIIALILIVIGVVFFAKALGFIENNTVDVLWPLLLVVVGFAMLSHRRFRTCCEDGTCTLCRVDGGAGKKRRHK